jgi:uncharacterized circularly permuted ATP-grasp superfamily protein
MPQEDMECLLVQNRLKEQQEFIAKIKHNPRNYIAQPMINLSRVPTLTEDTIEGRHVDLRPYALYGDSIKIIPGALTRVALKKDQSLSILLKVEEVKILGY